MTCFNFRQKGNGVFKGKKITKEKPVSQNVVCGKNISAKCQDKEKSIKPLKLEPCKRPFRLDGKKKAMDSRIKSFSSNDKSNSSIIRSLHGPKICLVQIAYYPDRDSQDSKGQNFQKDFYQGYNQLFRQKLHTRLIAHTIG